MSKNDNKKEPYTPSQVPWYLYMDMLVRFNNRITEFLAMAEDAKEVLTDKGTKFAVDGVLDKVREELSVPIIFTQSLHVRLTDDENKSLGKMKNLDEERMEITIDSYMKMQNDVQDLPADVRKATLAKMGLARRNEDIPDLSFDNEKN